MKASLKNFRQSPTKIRCVANAIRGKSVVEALKILDSTDKKSSLPMQKLILSAVSNAGGDKDSLMIESIMVDQGITLKRFRPRARGSAFPIRKRTSTILLKLK